ncbi:hypothetical protein U9M48_016059 [Paspalum notatum var. saurae]|uniref:Uncharacterized protein n=1 Tax=Paspalum notatum var. saurae TaxID=547442 RepID=A0AAQ3T5F1_PASNO
MLGEGSVAASPSGGAGVCGGRRLGELAVDAAALADAAGTEVREPAGPPPSMTRTRPCTLTATIASMSTPRPLLGALSM